VIAVHCKAGKGRTGVLICCYLVHSKLHPDVEEAMSFYAHQRTKNGKGVCLFIF
jgi:phosphatidylinositol-3,4,5-trisphosphate 3-phosphatase/dual-specificity protein phosphatase PTEN